MRIRTKILIFSLLIGASCFIRSYVVGIYRVSGHTWNEVIEKGDYVFVLKKNVFLDWMQGALSVSAFSPKRGDLVVTQCPSQRDGNCLKRVVGIAGDWVDLRTGRLLRESTDAGVGLAGHTENGTGRDMASLQKKNGTGWGKGSGEDGKTSMLLIPDKYLYTEHLRFQSKSIMNQIAKGGAHSETLVDGVLKFIVFSVAPGHRTTGKGHIRWARFFSALN